MQNVTYRASITIVADNIGFALASREEQSDRNIDENRKLYRPVSCSQI